MKSPEMRPGGRHCADVAGTFSLGWYDGAAPRPRKPAPLRADGPLWERARMTEDTRLFLLRLLFSES